MVKVKLNRILVEAHGKVDDLVFRRTRNGGMSLIRRADMSKVKWSPAQAENRRRFSQAVAQAHVALTDPKLKAKYEKAAVKAGKRAIEMAISDALKKLKNENT